MQWRANNVSRGARFMPALPKSSKASSRRSTKGHAAAETKAAFDLARTLFEKAEALGEPAEDPLLLYSVLYGFFIQKFIAFNGDVGQGRPEVAG